MEMKVLSTAERYNFYKTYLIQDFHKSELKPYERIEELVQQGKYICYGFFNNNEPLGYAYFVKGNIEDALLLDYFAVIKAYRSKGFGSSFLSEIKDKFLGKYSSLIAEVENPKFALDENNRSIRLSRINFYKRNGFKLSNVQSRVLIDEYLIITLDLGKQLYDKILIENLKQIYLNIFGKCFFEQNISIRRYMEQDEFV